MAYLIKNQILKHLSRYMKNLSADQINLSTFKGEGELKDLQLDEMVLTELLELPSWVQLTSAWCNKVSFRIQWTKLKTVPIFLVLDEVKIEIETCEELRSMSCQQGLSTLANNAKYSFIHKVIDGMTIHVNSVSITFNSPAFIAKVQILRIKVQSKTPKWQDSDLRYTRLKDMHRNQIMIFKEIEWQTLRIEASSISDKNLPPLRLLTNTTRCRITIKKRLSDCFVIGCRLLLILDDLLWVLTDSQLKAALHFIDSLSGLIQKDTEITRKKKAARKLESLPEYRAQMSQQARMDSNEQNKMRMVFAMYDFIETSYHFCTQRIDLHFSEDPGVGRSCHPNLQPGGSLQLTVSNLQADYYPYHLAAADRGHWARYRESGDAVPAQWLKQAHAAFRTSLLHMVSDAGQYQPTGGQDSPQARSGTPSPSSLNPLKAYMSSQFSKLMTSCVILRVEDFTLYRVTTTSKMHSPRPFVKGDRERYMLPTDLKTIHAEFTYYYYPGDIPFPLPPPKFYVHINPVQVYFDVLTLLWLNCFVLNLYQSLMATSAAASLETAKDIPTMYMDVRLEAISPRLIFESLGEHTGQRDRPKSLHLQVGRVSLTNQRTVAGCSRADLAKCIHHLQRASLFYATSDNPTDFKVVTDKFIDHLNCSDNIRQGGPPKLSGNIEEINKQLSREMLWIESKDVWCIVLEPLFGDFYGVRAIGSARPAPFLDAVTVTLWLHTADAAQAPQPQGEAGGGGGGGTENGGGGSENGSGKWRQQNGSKDMSPSGENRLADIHAVAHISLLVSLQINHYQFLFLLRVADEAKELTTFLAMDSNRLLGRAEGSSLVVGAVLPQLEVTLVMPAHVPGKESSGGDLESVIPDSSSLADDPNTNTSIQWHHNLSTDIPSTTGRVTMNDQEGESGDMGGGGRRPPLQHANSFSVGLASPTLPEPTSTFNLSHSVKKGFSSLFTSIDTAFKANNDDQSDTISLRSDASSDSEKYIMVNVTADRNGEAAADAMFRVSGGGGGGGGSIQERVEVASEVTEEDTPTLTTPSERDSIASSYKRRDLISVVTFKLGQVELFQQAEGFLSTIKLQLSNLEAEECISIPWDEFQSKFMTRSRVWQEMNENGAGARASLRDQQCACVVARLDHRVTPQDPAQWRGVAYGDWFEDLLTVHVANTRLALSTSTLAGLADLVEDELISPPLPVQMTIENVRLRICDDQQTTSNITCPGSVPVDVCVSQLHVSRGPDGVLHVRPLTRVKQSPSTAHAHETSQVDAQLVSENEQLRRRLAALEKINDENNYMRRCEEEATFLKSCLSAAQENIASLLEEKQKLLDLVQRLQEQTASRADPPQTTKR
ncbi:UHRF1-binding protein 1-like isoform X2 [Nilaparvata lugens]|uniref:UHRF1-binding protein 1-like isoform X2 n=1 Tax=Nilaparvata lugens TaxID=108931 RepID=UPI00193D45D2|nr:UHRF1-binding protein 1-like isoform X2 [Nilaparvata lugens]